MTSCSSNSHPEDGILAGVKWEQDLWQHLRQSGAVIVLCTGNWIASPWCLAEAMIARERGKPVFTLASDDISDGRQVKGTAGAGPQIPDFLKDTQFISLAGATINDAYQQLWRGLAGLKKDIFPLPDQPYPGLMAFDEKDAAVFFGRDAEIAEVNEVLNRRRRNNAKGFILILGASGCGKSSLVRAGVVPRLKRANTDAGATVEWAIVPPFLGGMGLHGLAVSLEKAFKDAGQPRDINDIREGRATVGDLRTLGSKLRLAHDTTEGLVLVVLDQLEQVFGTPAGSEQRTMLGLLLDASAEIGSRIVVLATMRSDYLNAFQQFEGAANRYEEVTLDPMPRSCFAAVIEGPADRFGLELEAGLSERMAEDTAYSDALPLLAFTLEKLYEECGADGQLELEAYEKLFPEVRVHGEDGSKTTYRGVSAAIKHAADEILEQTGYADLLDDDPRMRDLRRAFYSLAQVGEEGQSTRRIARWSQMPASCTQILEKFVKERLLVFGAARDKHKNSVERTLSVAHEALFRVWDTLGAWLRKDRKALALRSQIEEAASEWQAADRAASRAWPEERILDAVRQIEKSGVSLADVTDRATVDAFLGPIDPVEIARLLALDEQEDAKAGSGRYGHAWHLPLSHEARASAGVRLALLGDNRPGVGLRADGLPDIDWRRIEGSDITIEIRANPDDPNSEIIKTLTRTVEPLWVARYPVTIAQFQAFIKDCYRDGKWQLPRAVPVDLPASYPPPKHRARYGNYPADTVNWWDAQAFCHWLGARLGFAVRLPTEYEWQQAATGGDPTRTYPWGTDWAPGEGTLAGEHIRERARSLDGRRPVSGRRLASSGPRYGRHNL